MSAGRRPHLVPLAVIVLAALLVAGCRAFGQAQSPALDDFGAAPAFALTDQIERPVRSEDFQGTVVVASFIYTSCRDICPGLTLRMRQLQTRLEGERLLGDRVQLLSFTVDPERDTPSVLHAYAEQFQADPQSWRFLSGPPAELVPLIVDGFRLGVQALPPPEQDHSSYGTATAPHYEVLHSGRFVLIDRKGHIRAYYDGTDVDLERVVREIRSLLR